MSDYLLNVGKSNHLAVGSLRNTSGKFSPKVVADFNLVKWLGSSPIRNFWRMKNPFFSLENLPGKSRYTYMLSLADHPKAWFSLTCNIFTLFSFYKQKVCLIHLGPAPRAKNPPSVAKLLRTWFLCRIRGNFFNLELLVGECCSWLSWPTSSITWLKI